MNEFFIAISIVGIVILAICCYKLKKAIDDLKKTVNDNRQYADSEISTVDKKIRNCHSRLDEAAKVIKADQKLIESIEQQISDIENEIAEIKEPIKDFIASKKLVVEDILDDDLKDDDEATIKLDDEQLEAYTRMNESNSNLFITGKAGTGKSYLLRNFVKNTKKNVLVLAPTGVAALNIDGITIHSAFGWRYLNELSIEEITAHTLSYMKDEKKHILKNIQTIIIDEISMVRADIFEKIDKILKLLNHSKAAFGGKQIIVFGDLFQLPPIAKGPEQDYLNNTFGGIFFFNSKAYKKGNFEFIELTTNHRQQKDARFFEILNDIRRGSVTDEDLSIINEHIVSDPNKLEKTTIKLFPVKEKANAINNRELDNIQEREYRFTWSVEHLKPLTSKQVKDALNDMPVTETLRVKKGAVVMMVNNDVNGHWVNGTLGIVGDIYSGFIEVIIKGNVYKVDVAAFEYSEPTYRDGEIKYEPIVRVSQYPFVPAYAITIHKSQGMTYQQIAVDISRSFAPGQVYVALSRCASLDGLNLLSPVTKENLAVDPDVMKFYKSLQKQNR